MLIHAILLAKTSVVASFFSNTLVFLSIQRVWMNSAYIIFSNFALWCLPLVLAMIYCCIPAPEMEGSCNQRLILAHNCLENMQFENKRAMVSGSCLHRLQVVSICMPQALSLSAVNSLPWSCSHIVKIAFRPSLILEHNPFPWNFRQTSKQLEICMSDSRPLCEASIVDDRYFTIFIFDTEDLPDHPPRLLRNLHTLDIFLLNVITVDPSYP